MPRLVVLLAALALVAWPRGASAQTGGTSPILPAGPAAGEGLQSGTSASSQTATTAAATPNASPAPSSETSQTNLSRALQPTPPPPDLENRTTPIVDVHGYMRTRFALYQNFSLGWENVGSMATTTMAPSAAAAGMIYNQANLPWYRNPDFASQFCGPQPAPGTGMLLSPTSGSQFQCGGSTQLTANMRMRLEPELHPTEFLAIYTQIDLLDNVVLGSTPLGYFVPGGGSSFAPIAILTNNQITPVAGYNSWVNSILVNRAWAEVTNPSLGTIKFGRMPSQWGLGILDNAGSGMDSDFQTNVDRLMYALRLRQFGDIFGALMVDFPQSNPTNMNPNNEPGFGQPVSTSFNAQAHELAAAIGRRLEPELARQALARDEIVINGGLYFVYRQESFTSQGLQTPATNLETCTVGNMTGYAGLCGQFFVREDANIFIPDLWVQVLGHHFRFEAEGVFEGGTIRNVALAQEGVSNNQNNNFTLISGGFAIETEYRALNDRLILQLNGGYASGDQNMDTLNYNVGNGFFNTGVAGAPVSANGVGNMALNSQTLSLFAFHPDYRVDLIFWREIMQQVVGAYYFRPSIGYNFIDEPGGDLFYGRVDAIYSRASDFMQTRGHHSDLGVEIDATLQYQSNHYRLDGTQPQRLAPGFYANLQGGVFFPLAGLGPTDAERTTSMFMNFGLETAFVVRALLGVAY